MSETDYTKCSIFIKTAFLIIFINFCTSAPVNITENPYTQFIAELNRNECSVPSQVQLPFNTTKVNNFEYLSSYLEICQNTKSTKRNKEAVVLCKEIFDNVKNISCPTKTALPDISVELSNNVCKDIGALKDSVPEEDMSLLKRLTDGFLCDIMCDSEFEKACQVLLWSFEVQKLIASVASSQEPEQPNVPEDGGDINADNFKQDNTVDEGSSLQVGVSSENGKQNSEEAKDVNEVPEHDGIAEVPGLHEVQDNTEQKPDETANPSKIEKQEKPVPVNEAVLENQTVFKARSQELTDASKLTSNLKTSSTISQQTTVTSNSNTELKPIVEITKGESNVQKVNKQLQGTISNMPVVKHDKVDAGNLLSKDSNTNLATNEQTEAVDANIVDDKQVQDEKHNLPPDEHIQDNSNIPGNPNIPVTGEDGPNNDIIGEMPKEPDQNPNFLDDNQLPHELGNEKSPNDAAADLQNNEQNPFNPVDTLAQNKLQTTASNDGKLAEKTDVPNTGTQTNKDATQPQTIQETTLDNTSIARDETKADQPQTNSGLRKVETQDETKADAIKVETQAETKTNAIKVETQAEAKTNAITHGLVTDEGTRDVLTDQKKPKVAQQTEEFDNTIPDTTGTSIAANKKLPEKSPKSKSTAANLDGESVIPSSLTEASTKTTVALEKMEGGSDLRPPVDEESDHYGDLENTEDDYSRPEYDGGLYEGSKTKESNPDVPSPIAVAKEIIANQNEKPIEFPNRNSFGQDSSDIQMIGFPEQEDGHFFFYFLSIVLILMAGYLIFHNKQKIIALIVEGRHERNRRSHRIGYKKLETK